MPTPVGRPQWLGIKLFLFVLLLSVEDARRRVRKITPSKTYGVIAAKQGVGTCVTSETAAENGQTTNFNTSRIYKLSHGVEHFKKLGSKIVSTPDQDYTDFTNQVKKMSLKVSCEQCDTYKIKT